MAKKNLYTGKLNKEDNWGGPIIRDEVVYDAAAGSSVQDYIKENFDGKFGYLHRDELNSEYKLFADEDAYQIWVKTGDDALILGRIQIESNYRHQITLGEGTYLNNAALLGETGNYVKILVSTTDKNGSPIVETSTITYIITRPDGSHSSVLHYGETTEGKNQDELLIDEFISEGMNTITITSVGNNTGAIANMTIYFQVVNLTVKDDIDISAVHDISGGKTDSLRILWNITGSSESTKYIEWYVDGVKQEAPRAIEIGATVGSTEATVSINSNFTEGHHNIQYRAWLTAGNKIFYTSTYYRDFIVYKGESNQPIIAVALTLPIGVEPLTPDQCFEPIAYNVIQYNKYEIPTAVYQNGVLSTNLVAEVNYFEGSLERTDVRYEYNVPNNQVVTVTLTPSIYGDAIVKFLAGQTGYVLNTNIEKIGFNIQEDNVGVILNLRANGKSNSASDREVWEYHDTINNITYTTTFSGFTWDEKSGWNDNSLIISRGNSIDIDIKPLTREVAQRGLTFEMEYSTINVADDNEILLNMRDAGNLAPGLTITASEAIFRDNSGNIVSTKFKSGENNRIAFVVAPNASSKSFIYIYVNGSMCGAANYSISTASFAANKTIHIEGTSQAEIKLKHIRIYNRPLGSDVLVNNYILYRDSYDEMRAMYNFNNVYANEATIDGILSLNNIEENIPVLLITDFDKYSEGGKNNVETLQHFGAADKGTYVLIRQIEFVNNADPTTCFLIDYPQMRCQGTSSMAYPRKNFRFYTKDKAKRDDWIDPETKEKLLPIVYFKDPETGEWKQSGKPGKGKISFKSGKVGTSSEGERPAQEVTAWCLKADYAESSSSHNTGVARLWNQVLRDTQVEKTYVGRTIAQEEAMKPESTYKYDVRTCVDGFPIVIFSRDSVTSTTWNYIGKYNFNNDKSTESVFGFCDIPGIAYQEYSYVDSTEEEFNSAPETVKQTTVKNFVAEEDIPTEDFFSLCPTPYEYSKTYQKLNITLNDAPYATYYYKKNMDGGDTSVKNYCVEYLENENSLTNYTVDGNDPEKGFFAPIKDDKGKTVENWTLSFEFRYPEVDEDLPDADTKGGITNLKEFYDWVYSTRHVESEYNPEKDNTVIIVGETKRDGDRKYHQGETDVYANDGTYTAANFEESAAYKKLKFEKEKWDYLDVFKMAAYYVYFMRFGGVDQVVKNSMMYTEGTVAYAYDGTKYEKIKGTHCKWFFINYDNDTILGLDNDGNLSYDPTIDRSSRVGEGESAGYVYAGHNSTLWNNLEEDEEFMQIVSAVDNGLYEAGLTYDKAVEVFNKKQADKWCERLLNKDSDFKYIQTYVSGEGEHLGKLQGPRTSHRTWWINKRFTLYDSKFLSGEYKNKYISFKAIVPEDAIDDAKFSVLPTELMNYGWGVVGRSNGETGIFSTKDEEGNFNPIIFMPKKGGMSGLAIGDEIHVYATPYVSEVDFSTIGSNLMMVDFTGVFNEVLGSQLKRIILGGEGVNNSGIDVNNFKAVDKADKLEYLNIEGFKNLASLDLSKNGLFKKLSAYNSGLQTLTLGNGTRIEELELPENYTTLVLDQASYITEPNIKFKNNNCSNVTKIQFINCEQLKERSFNFFSKWFNQRKETGIGLENTEVDMRGISWRIPYSALDIVEEYKNVETSRLNLTGKVMLTDKIEGATREETVERVERIKSIFGENCFNPELNPPVVVDCAVPFVIINSDIVEMTAKSGNEMRLSCEIYPYRVEGSNVAYKVVDDEGYETRDGVHITIDNVSGTAVLTADEAIVKKESNLVVRCIYNYVGSNDFTSDINIKIFDPTYPTRIVIEGSQSIHKEEEHHYDVYGYVGTSGTTEATGTYTYGWELAGEGLEYIAESGIGENDRQYYIKTNGQQPEASSKVYLTATATTYNGQTLVSPPKEILVLNENVIMTKESNPVAMRVFYEAGLTGGKTDVMLKSDAEVITNEKFGTIFAGVTDEFTLAENELKYFTNLTELPEGAFSGSTGLSSIELPDRITKLGNYCFAGCTKLNNVKLSEGLTEISEGCFRGCTMISNILVPDGVKTLRNYSFIGTNITKLIPVSKTTKDKSLIVPDGLETIEDYAFEENVVNPIKSKLTSIMFPSGLKSLGANNFILRGSFITEILVDEDNMNYSSIDGVLYNKTLQTMFKYPCAKTGDIYQPVEGCLAISAYGFYNTKLKDITITPNIQTLGVGAFSNSFDLETVNMQANNSISVIPNEAFSGCSKLTNIYWGTAIETIGDSAIKGCDAIVDLVMPNTVKAMGSNAVFENTNLKAFTFPKYMKLPTTCVLRSNKNLEAITLPLFSVDDGETEIIYNSTYPVGTSMPIVHYDATNLRTLIVPEEDNHKHFAVIDNAVYGVVDDVVTQLISVPYGKEQLTIPDTVTTIKDSACLYCAKLKNFTIPETVTIIEKQAFWGCNSLTEMTIPSGVTNLNISLFFTSTKIEKVVVETSGLTDIGGLVFANCPQLSTIIIKNKLEKIPTIGDNTFRDTGVDAPERNIYVDSSLVEAYKADTSWKELMTREKPFNILPIEPQIFALSNNLKAKTLNKSTDILELQKRIEVLENIIKNLTI